MIKFLNLAFDSMCYIVYLIDTQMSNTDMKPILIYIPGSTISDRQQRHMYNVGGTYSSS